MSEVSALHQAIDSEAPSLDELHKLSDGEIADQITTWAGRIAAGEARLLAYVGEFEAREAWGGPGMLSCAHWMSWRLGMGLGAAYERVRVARALRVLPKIAGAFAAGQLSWTQVRAVTRVATPADEQTYLHAARHASGAQIERLTRGVRRARRLAEYEANPDAVGERTRCVVRYEEDGTMVITARLPAEQGAVVLAAIEQARAELDEQRRHAQAGEAGCGKLSSAGESSADQDPPSGIGAPDGDPPADGALPTEGDSRGDPAGCGKLSSAEEPAANRADGLLRLCQRLLDVRGQQRPEAARRSRSRLTVRLDPLSGWARLPDGELLPPAAALAVCDLGRARREPDLALRELLCLIDGERCRFPGCARRRKLHAHHVTEWAAGGRTDLANLILLCSRHHTLVHADGYRLTVHADRRLDVATSDGASIPHLPSPHWQPAADLDRGHGVGPNTLPPRATQPRIDLGYAVSVLMQQAA